jgi:hypothetical protein
MSGSQRMSRLDNFAKDLPGLQSLSRALKHHTGQDVSPIDCAYIVRQLHIGTGCLHGCTHCFANPSGELEQMHFDSFARIAAEFGEACHQNQKPFPFLYLGASSDPSVIVDFARYLETWVISLPKWHSHKFFTHGWVLSNTKQRNEYSVLLEVLLRLHEHIQTFAISVDIFSHFARHNWLRYLENVSANLRGFAKVLDFSSLRLQVHYPLSRLDVVGPYTMSYWHERALQRTEFPTTEEIFSILANPNNQEEQECCRLTAGVFRIGELAGFSPHQTALMTWDGGVPFAAGRAQPFFKYRKLEDASRALNIQRTTTLRSLAASDMGTQGLMLFPNGSARMVDYLGYRLGDWLNEGNPVIPYARSWRRQDRPWQKLDFDRQN